MDKPRETPGSVAPGTRTFKQKAAVPQDASAYRAQDHLLFLALVLPIFVISIAMLAFAVVHGPH